MHISLRIALIIIMIIYVFFIAKAVKRKNMRISYLIFWMIIGFFLIGALIFPKLVDNISDFIGFEVPINMIFTLAIFIVLYFIHELMKLVSEEEKKNTILIQEISILKKKVEELENNMNQKTEGE